MVITTTKQTVSTIYIVKTLTDTCFGYISSNLQTVQKTIKRSGTHPQNFVTDLKIYCEFVHKNSTQSFLVLSDCKCNDDVTPAHSGNALLYYFTNPGLILRLNITEICLTDYTRSFLMICTPHQIFFG
jgi:hypothetical protein